MQDGVGCISVVVKVLLWATGAGPLVPGHSKNTISSAWTRDKSPYAREVVLLSMPVDSNCQGH